MAMAGHITVATGDAVVIVATTVITGETTEAINPDVLRQFHGTF